MDMDQSTQPVQGNGGETPNAESPTSAERTKGNPQPSLIHADTIGEDEATRLKDLATEVRDQDDLERDIGRQADQLLTNQANERDRKRLEKTQAEKVKFQSQIRKLHDRLNHPTGSAISLRLRAEISNLEAQIKTLDTDLEQIQERIGQRHEEQRQDGESTEEETGNRRLPNESQRDFLIRTGKITPFSKMPGRTLSRSDSTLQGVLLDAEDEEAEGEPAADETRATEVLSHRNLVQPGFIDDEGSDASFQMPDDSDRPKKRRRIHKRKSSAKNPTGVPIKSTAVDTAASGISSEEDEDAYIPDMDDREIASLGDSEGASSDGMEETSFLNKTPPLRAGSKRGRQDATESLKEDLTGLDDGNEKLYQNRLRSWVERRSAARTKANARKALPTNDFDDVAAVQDDNGNGEQTQHGHHLEEEWHLPHPVRPDTMFEGAYRVPGDVYPSLFDYQKTGVQWLWELYSQQVGGIVGDEMGLVLHISHHQEYMLTVR